MWFLSAPIGVVRSAGCPIRRASCPFRLAGPIDMNSDSCSSTTRPGVRREETAGGGPHPRAPAGEEPADDAASDGRRRGGHQRARSVESDHGRGCPAGRHGGGDSLYPIPRQGHLPDPPRRRERAPQAGPKEVMRIWGEADSTCASETVVRENRPPLPDTRDRKESAPPATAPSP